MRDATCTKLIAPETRELLDLADQVCLEAQEIRETVRPTIRDAKVRGAAAYRRQNEECGARSTSPVCEGS